MSHRDGDVCGCSDTEPHKKHRWYTWEGAYVKCPGIDGDQGYPPNTVALATVMGVPNVLVFRRKTEGGYDWAFNPDRARGITYSCASDREKLVKNIRPILTLGDLQVLNAVANWNDEEFTLAFGFDRDESA